MHAILLKDFSFPGLYLEFHDLLQGSRKIPPRENSHPENSHPSNFPLEIPPPLGKLPPRKFPPGIFPPISLIFFLQYFFT